jgi:hypothetical protein
VWTQSVDEFDAWMRTIDEKNQSVQQHCAQGLNAATVMRRCYRTRSSGSKTSGTAAVTPVTPSTWPRKAQARAADVVSAVAAKDSTLPPSQSIKVAETCTPVTGCIALFPRSV